MGRRSFLPNSITLKQAILDKYYEESVAQAEIARIYNCSRQYVSLVIKQTPGGVAKSKPPKRFVDVRNNIRRLNALEFTNHDIAGYLSVRVETVNRWASGKRRAGQSNAARLDAIVYAARYDVFKRRAKGSSLSPSIYPTSLPRRHRARYLREQFGSIVA